MNPRVQFDAILNEFRRQKNELSERLALVAAEVAAKDARIAELEEELARVKDEAEPPAAKKK